MIDMKFKELQFLFMPDYWHMNYLYNEKIDKVMSDLLDKHDFTFNYMHDGRFTALLGNIPIWVANRPYSTILPLDFGNVAEFRPSRLTIKRGIEKFNEAMRIRDEKELDIMIAKLQNETNPTK
jgi:hypothetical protein